MKTRKKTLLALSASLVLLASLGISGEYHPTLEDALMCYKRMPVSQAERMAKEMGYAGEDSRLFVRALRVWPLIRHYSKKFQLDPMISFRIAATESRFTEQMRGDAGEIGMYQLLPSTARDLWKWHRHECPEPRKSWESSTPNQIVLALKHVANIQKGLKRKNSLRSARLKDIYEIYNGGTLGLYGKPKKKWVLNNLRVTKNYETIAKSLDTVRVVRMRTETASIPSGFSRHHP